MPRVNSIYSIIVPAELADFNQHTYTEIYGGTVGCVIKLNGIVLDIAESSNISISIRSVSGGVGCYLLGENNDVFQGSPFLGNTIIDTNDYVDDYIDNYIG